MNTRTKDPDKKTYLWRKDNLSLPLCKDGIPYVWRACKISAGMYPADADYCFGSYIAKLIRTF